MKIVFIGASQYSWPCLEHLVKSNAHIVGVCTSVSHPFNSDHLDLSADAVQLGMKVITTDDINSDMTLDWIRSLDPDVIFCWGWSRLLKRPLLDLPPMGVVGYHPAWLPDHRGRHPLIWALALGLRETGSSFFFMDEGADTGDILNRRRIDIRPEDDATTMYQRMIDTMITQIDEFLPQLQNRNFNTIKQDLTQGRSWRKRDRLDGAIDWRMSAGSVTNLVRALTKPYVGAHFVHQGQEYKVWRCRSVQTNVRDAEPGLVLAVTSDGPIIATASEAVQILQMTPHVRINPGEYIG